MKNYKWLLTSLVSLIVLSACGSNEETTDTSKEEGSSQAGTTTIRVAYKDDGPSNENSVKFYDKLSEKLKEDRDLDVAFELVELAQGDYAEKLGLLLNSGDIPDLIYFQGGDQQIASQDILEDLTPYIEESEFLKDILEPHNVARLENYPYLLWVKPVNHKVPVIRQDLFNQLSTGEAVLTDPTIENYQKMLQEMVDKGLVDYSLTVAGDIAELDFIFENAFGIDQSWLETEDGYVFSKVSKEEKEKLAFYHELYQAGLLDKEYLTKQWDTKEDAFYNGQAGIITGTNGKVIDFYNTRAKEVNGDEAELIVLPPAKGIGQGLAPTDITKESRGLAISAISENKDLAFEILDYLASPEGQMLDRFGYEGEHYTVAGDEIKLTDKYAEWYARYWEPTGYEFPMAISEETPLLSEPAQKSEAVANEYYVEDNNFIIPEEMVSQWDAMENLYREYSADIITGKVSVDEFDTFVKAWYEAGGTALTELANETIQ